MSDMPEMINEVSGVAMHLAGDMEGAACLLLTAATLNAVHAGLSLKDVQDRLAHDYQMLQATMDSASNTSAH